MFHFLFEWQSTWHSHIHLMSYNFCNHDNLTTHTYICYLHTVYCIVYTPSLASPIFTILLYLNQQKWIAVYTFLSLGWVRFFSFSFTFRATHWKFRSFRMFCEWFYITRYSNFVQGTWVGTKRMTKKKIEKVMK